MKVELEIGQKAIDNLMYILDNVGYTGDEEHIRIELKTETEPDKLKVNVTGIEGEMF